MVPVEGRKKRKRKRERKKQKEGAVAGTLAVRLMPRDSEIKISDLMFSLDGSQMDFFFPKGVVD